MDLTQDALRELQDIRAALQDTIDYLERLPPVPVTREFCRNLRARLNAKPMMIAQERRHELHGQGSFTPAGVPLVEATLTPDNVLTIGLPREVHGAMREHALERLVVILKGGGAVSVQLEERIGTAQEIDGLRGGRLAT
jgi:hypothetical protein